MNRFLIDLPAGELDFPLCVTGGQVFRWRQREDGTWLGVDGPFWYRVRDLSAPSRTTLEVEGSGDRTAFRALFGLDESVVACAARWADVPELRASLARRPGLRVLRCTDAVEGAVSFLCTANNNLARIVPMVRALAAAGPVIAEVGGEPVHRFPELAAVAALSEAELRRQGFGYRAATIPRAAAHLQALGGRDWLEGLRQVPYEDAFAALVQVPGVGPKLADCIALFALHHPRAVPVDTHVWRMALVHFFPEWQGKSLTLARYRAIGDRLRSTFGDDAGWAHQHLFTESLHRGR